MSVSCGKNHLQQDLSHLICFLQNIQFMQGKKKLQSIFLWRINYIVPDALQVKDTTET